MTETDVRRRRSSERTKRSNDRRSRRRRKLSFLSLRRNRYILAAALLVSVFLLSLGALALASVQDQQKILNGVTIAELKVGDLTMEEARVLVDDHANALLSQPLKLNVEQQTLEVTLADLGLRLDRDLTLQEAYDVGRQGSGLAKAFTNLVNLFSNRSINIAFKQDWNEDSLRQTLKESLEQFDKPAVDATLVATRDNTVTVMSEQTGSVINYEALVADIEGLNIYEVLPNINVEFEEQLPQVTAAQVEEQKITGLLSSYTTKFNPGETARSENVRLAANALDMALIKPGEILSFNGIVGERTVDAGYKDAYIILNGEFVPGLAGGICQVSSTLYNTGLLANLEIAQRSNHDLAITYVPLGQDATVAYPSLDLKFNNNTDGYILIRSWVSYDALTIEMYGKVKSGQEVAIANTIDEILPFTEQRLADETMAAGESQVKQQGQPGYVVRSTRTVKVKGEVISTESLPQSRYSPLPKILNVGPPL